MKYLTALFSTVDSIKNFARVPLEFVKVPLARNQTSSRLKGYLRLADQNKQLEDVIHELENQIKLRDRLLSIIAHDTRAPLNSLKSLLPFLSSKRLDPDELHEITFNLNQQVEHLNNFLENLLQWTKDHYDQLDPKKESLPLRPLAIKTIELLSFLANKKNVHIHCFIADGEIIYSDAEMIRIILRNLISNAIKFCDPHDGIFVQAYQTPENVIISVRDTGRGIGKENLEKLFQFSNLSTRGTKDELGTGLGLTLCREFVEKLGGTIQASSVEGRGSCFEFTVPHALKEQVHN